MRSPGADALQAEHVITLRHYREIRVLETDDAGILTLIKGFLSAGHMGI